MEVVIFREHAAAEIDGLHHAARCQDTQHHIEVRVLRNHRFIQRIGKGFTAVHIYLKTLFINSKRIMILKIPSSI